MRVTLAGAVGVVLASQLAIAGPRPAPNPDVGGMPDPDSVGSPPPANDLDRSAILAAMATVKRKVMECGDQLAVGGTLRAKVTVAPSGKVTNATAEGIDDAALQACVVKIMKTVKLPKSDRGGVFSFPFNMPATDLSDTLDAEVIDKGLAKLEKKISACHNAGTITMIRPQALKLDVDPSGKVTRVWTYAVSGDRKTDDCVERVFKSARFPTSKDGGAFIYPRQPTPVATNPVNAGSTTDLDPASITRTIAANMAAISRCGDATRLSGRSVKATVTVGADGKVTSATASGSTDPKLDTCVASVIQGLTFERSKNGATFTYPFVFSVSTAGMPVDPFASSGKPPDVVADELDRAAITQTIARNMVAISRCGDGSNNAVKANVAVGADGKVTSATAEGSGDAKVDACFASALQALTFPKSKNGGVFTYPFKFISPAPTASPPHDPFASPTTGATSALDRAMISDGIAKVKDAISKCGDGKTKGVVKISVRVAPEGAVTSAKVTQTPGDALGACVAGVISKATFAKTGQGGSFSYPFVF